MRPQDKYLIKQALRKAKWVKGRPLTNAERIAVRKGKMAFMKVEEPKGDEENFKPLTKEPKSIGEILKGD